MALDLVLVGLFLAILLAVGLHKSRGIKTFAEYAVGLCHYSSWIITVTIFATMVGASSTAGVAEQVYRYGIVFLVVPLGSLARDLFTAYFILPRLIKKNALSPGDLMGQFFGTWGQICTGVVGFVSCSISFCLQTYALGFFCEYFFRIPQLVGVSLCVGTMIVYTSLGGFRAKTATDVVSFGFLVMGITIIFAASLEVVGRYKGLMGAVPLSHISFPSEAKDTIRFSSMFFLFALSGLHPSQFQRFLIDRNLEKLQGALLRAIILYVPLFFMVAIAGLAALMINPHLAPEKAILFMVDTLGHTLPRSLAIFAILAAVMSTADSYLQMAGLMLTHDVINPLRETPLEKGRELYVARIATFIIGILSTLLALNITSIFELSLLAFSVWTPAIVGPMLLGLFGINASFKTFVISACCGVFSHALWGAFVMPILFVEPTPISLLISVVAFLLVRRYEHSSKLLLAK